jgi:hypothetical protein
MNTFTLTICGTEIQEQVEVAIVSTNGDVEEALKHLRSSNGYWNTSVLESKESSQVNNLSFPLLLCV